MMRRRRQQKTSTSNTWPLLPISGECANSRGLRGLLLVVRACACNGAIGGGAGKAGASAAEKVSKAFGFDPRAARQRLNPPPPRRIGSPNGAGFQATGLVEPQRGVAPCRPAQQQRRTAECDRAPRRLAMVKRQRRQRTARKESQNEKDRARMERKSRLRPQERDWVAGAGGCSIHHRPANANIAPRAKLGRRTQYWAQQC